MHPLLRARPFVICILLLYMPLIQASNAKIKLVQRHSVQQQKPKPAGNVWERIRSGIDVFMPTVASPSLLKPAESSAPTLANTKPAYQYPYKRYVFSPALSKKGATDNKLVAKSRLPDRTVVNVPHQTINLKTEVHIKGDLGKPRIRSQINVAAKPEPKSGEMHAAAPSNSANPLPAQAILQIQAEPFVNEAAMPNDLLNKQTMINDKINQHVAWYSERSSFLQQVTGRASPYLFHIVDTLVKNRLPAELALLPIVESAYQTNAQSPKSAAGLWQFIPGTGLEYDLQQSQVYDERFEIMSSTQAAARYLRFLHQRYHGDWLLALAAYNCGPGTIDNALTANQSQGLATDFWSLTLPEETQHYVPRFLALVKIFANPDAYGLKPKPVDDEPYLVKLAIDGQADVRYLANKSLAQVAQLAGLTPSQFALLNPAHLATELPATGPYHFVMPIDNANQLHRHLAHIGQTFAPPLDNQLDIFTNAADTNIGQYFKTMSLPTFPYLSLDFPEYKLPLAKPSPENNATEQQASRYAAVHYVGKGETLKSIAHHYGVRLETLCTTNRVKIRQSLAWGQRLLIPSRGFIIG